MTVDIFCRFYELQNILLSESIFLLFLCRIINKRLTPVPQRSLPQEFSGPWPAANHPWQPLHAHRTMWVSKRIYVFSYSFLWLLMPFFITKEYRRHLYQVRFSWFIFLFSKFRVSVIKFEHISTQLNLETTLGPIYKE